MSNVCFQAFPGMGKINLPFRKVPLFLSLALKYSKHTELSPKCQNYAKCIESLSNIKSIGYKDYFIVFKICLYLEQYQLDLETKQLRRKSKTAKIIPNQYFIIKMPSVDNERSTIVQDDTVILYHTITKEEYKGKVIKMVGDDVKMQLEYSVATKLQEDLNKSDIVLDNFYFPLQCCHHAISLANKLSNFLDIMYPQSTINNIVFSCDINWINTNIPKNEEQKQAVINILHMTAHPAPYILFGPPGTGKTATLVEAICQIVKQDARNNVLVCTSSNAAADEITLRLLKHLPTDIVFRMYAPSRNWEEIETDIQQCANFVHDRSEYSAIFLPKEILILKRVIISTLITSIRLTDARLRENHFSHIIIDEASQASEPEMLIPITLLKDKDENDITKFQAQIVIAGDPYQLGPVVHNKLVEHILGKSMLERLMNDCDLYKKKDGKYDPKYVTKLIQNFRNHEHILHVPNKHFYEGELVCCGYQADTQIALNWDKLPSKGFPIIFQEVLGIEETTWKSSVYNTVELLVVVEYVKMLMNVRFGDHVIKQEDIGIITPFKEQQLSIMHKLAVKGWEKITVGTVEMFQGQERTVIILSTVRSKIFNHDDIQHIGFLSNEKRFNVAVTRAKALLIIIGNPIICINKHWKALWEYSKLHGGYKSFTECPLPRDIIEMLKKQYRDKSRDADEATAALYKEVSIEISVKDGKTAEELKVEKELQDTFTNIGRRHL